MLGFLEDVRRDLNAVETSSDRQTALKKEVAELAAAYESAAKKLTAARTSAANVYPKR